MIGFLLGALAGYIWMRGFIVPIIRAMIEYTPARELRRRERYEQNWRERLDKPAQLMRRQLRIELKSIERLQRQQRTGSNRPLAWMFYTP